MPDVTSSNEIGAVDVSLQRTDAGEKPMGEKEQSALLLPSHVLLDAIPGPDSEAKGDEAGDQKEGRNGVGSMEGLYFLDDDLTKVSYVFCIAAITLTSVDIRESLATLTIPLSQPKRLSWRLPIRARSARTASGPDIE